MPRFIRFVSELKKEKKTEKRKRKERNDIYIKIIYHDVEKLSAVIEIVLLHFVYRLNSIGLDLGR